MMMTKSHQQAAILSVLILVMIGVYARAFRSPRHAAQPASSAQAPGAAAPSPDVAEASEWPDYSAQRQAQEEEAMQLAWARDPFARGASTGGVAGLSLSGILWDATAPMAIISGQTLGIGDEISGFHVTEIHPDRVSLSDGVETVSLTTTP